MIGVSGGEREFIGVREIALLTSKEESVTPDLLPKSSKACQPRLSN